MHDTVRIDRPDALGHGLDLGPTDIADVGMDLPVGVGHTDIVEIEQRDLAHPAARQRLGRPGADAADADHRHMGGRQTLETETAIQAGNTAETLLIDVHATPRKQVGYIIN
ncbi:hypothetical protein D3C81_1154670 [compost metagenome]